MGIRRKRQVTPGRLDVWTRKNDWEGRPFGSFSANWEACVLNEQAEQRLALLFAQRPIFGVVSQRKKEADPLEACRKVQLRPFEKNGELYYQFTRQYDKKATHYNLPAGEAPGYLAGLLDSLFSQCVLYTPEHDYHLLCFGGRLKCKTLPPSRRPKEGSLAHDRSREYLLSPDGGYDFLIRLGVMDREGRVIPSRYDKFRQINKYLELAADCVRLLPRDRILRIVDFGCGKSYLTFALYHYLVKVQGLKAQVIGLDLKEDVVDFCNTVARDLGYDRLSFVKGAIKGFSLEEFARRFVQDGPQKEETDGALATGGEIDMVVTLHACDTATDDAIVQALRWNCRVLLTVPCCQHEFYSKISNPDMTAVTRHGILRERLAAILTDAVRGQLLESLGYTTGIMEFIQTEHTPKNLLIKAVRRGERPGWNPAAFEEYRRLTSLWQVRPDLEDQLAAAGLLQSGAPAPSNKNSP